MNSWLESKREGVRSDPFFYRKIRKSEIPRKESKIRPVRGEMERWILGFEDSSFGCSQQIGGGEEGMRARHFLHELEACLSLPLPFHPSIISCIKSFWTFQQSHRLDGRKRKFIPSTVSSHMLCGGRRDLVSKVKFKSTPPGAQTWMPSCPFLPSLVLADQ